MSVTPNEKLVDLGRFKRFRDGEETAADILHNADKIKDDFACLILLGMKKDGVVILDGTNLSEYQLVFLSKILEASVNRSITQTYADELVTDCCDRVLDNRAIEE